MKKLVLIAYEQKARDLYVKQLLDFFGDRVDIKGYSVDAEKKGEFDLRGADIVLLSFADVTQYISHCVTAENQVMYIARSFEKEKLAPLSGVKNGEKAALADYSETLAFETIGILNACGYNHIDYKMLLPGDDNHETLPSDIRIAITTENVTTVPATVEKIINIGWYRISWMTFAEIARGLDILDDDINEKLNRYSEIVASTNQGIIDTIKYTWTTEKQLAAVVESMNDAVIVTDLEYRVIQSNSAAGLLTADAGGKALKDIRKLPESLRRFLLSGGKADEEIVSIKETGRTVVVSRKPIVLYGESQGYLFVVRNVNEIQRLENDYRIMMAKKGFCAKYSFDDIITTSPHMRECIDICQKIAVTDLAILLTGESGVGKEMFAQSIHHFSNRSRYPFVAVNCAALPRDLLESELFGFDEGAFTGAKKGGKKGLFELAHKGTIFLDEVGDMPLSTQAKLLRVLQEKEVMHVGGTSVTPVDVRVISASNVDFSHMFEERLFRRDLYYRLNNAKVRIPSLAERIGDIPLLCQAFCEKAGAGPREISGELIEKLKANHWDGNVRELKNCVEYMIALGGERLTAADLPPDYQTNENGREKPDQEGSGPKQESRLASLPLLPEEALLAEAILGNLRQRRLGRRRLKLVLEQQGIKASEYKIKQVVDRLKGEGILK